MPGGAVPAALGPGLGLPGLWAWRQCRAEGPGGLPVQPLQAPSRADRGHSVPLDQTAPYRVVPGDLPPLLWLRAISPLGELQGYGGRRGRRAFGQGLCHCTRKRPMPPAQRSSFQSGVKSPTSTV